MLNLKIFFAVKLFLSLISCFSLVAVLAASEARAFPLSPVAVANKGFLRIEAKVTFGDEDQEVVPLETDFYLLDRSLVSILKSARFIPSHGNNRQHFFNDQDYLEATARLCRDRENSEENEILVFLITEALAKHRIAEIRTDQDGIGKFRGLPPGNYYLFGTGKTESEILIWNLPVRVDLANPRLTVDQYNAALIIDGKDR